MNRFGYEHRTTESVEWFTPPEVFEALGLEFDLDPAAPVGGVPWVPAKRWYSAREDGLVQPWLGRVWLNPPAGGRVRPWLDRLAGHGDGVALVFARTDAVWFQQAAPKATAVCFIARRLAFIPGDGQTDKRRAPAGSALLAYGIPSAVAVAEAGLGQTLLVANAGTASRQ